jgi:hypothetical protein
MIGIIQCSLACADQPYQLHDYQPQQDTWEQSTYNNPTGTKSDPTISAGMRISGSPLPPFFFDS